MKLDQAMLILAESHTRDDDRAGFVVESVRDRHGRWTDRDYIEAWKVVRQHLRMQVEPAE